MGLVILIYIIIFTSLLTMSIRAGVVPAVTFQQVNAAPDGQNRADGDDEGLKHRDRLIEKSHSFLSRISGLSRKTG